MGFTMRICKHINKVRIRHSKIFDFLETMISLTYITGDKIAF